MNEETLIYEGELSEQLGLDRRALAQIRKGLDLIQDVDWCHGSHRRLMLTPSGVKKITAAAMAEQREARRKADEEAAGAGGASADDVGAVERPVIPVVEPVVVTPKKMTARVVRVPRFAKILECRTEGRENLLRVKVQKNENFEEGMEVPIRQALGLGPDVYYYDGVLPKRKGVLPKTR